VVFDNAFAGIQADDKHQKEEKRESGEIKVEV
jgi:hypothetical protein